MSRLPFRKFSKLVVTALLIFFSYSSCLYAQPNIVIIISDDHAYQAISAYGSKITQTPAIDRIANEGAIFKRALVTNSICGPARAAIITGKYSHKNGFKDNENSNFNFNQDIFLKRLQQAGYQTAWFGKMHLGDSIPQGLDHYNILPGQGHYYNPDFIETGNIRKRHQGYVANITEDFAEEWMDQRNKNKPFCVVIGHKGTHRTWMPDIRDLRAFENTTFRLPETFYDDYATRKGAQLQDMTIEKTMRMTYDLKMFDSREEALKDGNFKRMDKEQQDIVLGYYDSIYADLKKRNLSGHALTEWKFQRYMRDYLGTAISVDRNIGRALDYLDKNDLAQNTIVIYLSDQGFYLGEHGWFDKRWIYEESVRTPMVMRYPGVIAPGRAISQQIANIDIAPTLLEVAGAPVPEEMDGFSFLPLLKNDRYHTRKNFYYHYYENGEHSVSPHFGIVTDRYKLFRMYKRVEGWELIDNLKDPHELTNVYGKREYRKVEKKLKRDLLRLIRQYGDGEAEVIFKQGSKGLG